MRPARERPPALLRLLWLCGHAEMAQHPRVAPIADRLSLIRRSPSTPTPMYLVGCEHLDPPQGLFSSVPPKFIRPCIPTTAKAIPQGEAWLHEPKLDGYRFQIVKDGRQVKLYSRSGHEWTKRLASLAEALQAIPRRAVVLDAELCFPGSDGGPDFGGLRTAFGAGRTAS